MCYTKLATRQFLTARLILIVVSRVYLASYIIMFIVYAKRGRRRHDTHLLLNKVDHEQHVFLEINKL